MYKTFIQDYNNPDLTTNDIIRKNRINSKKYCKLRKQAIQNGDISPTRHMNTTGAKFYTKKDNHYVVKKTTNGETTIIGSFSGEDTAKKVVSKCKEVNWEINKIKGFIDENKLRPKNYYLLNGYYVITKQNNNNRQVYCRVKQENEAKQIVNELDLKNWDYNKMEEILEKLQINTY